jgi:Excalibur calcium-binding domain
VIVVVALAKRGRSTPRTNPTTRFSTTTPRRPAVYYKNYAEAHADGRWDIPEGDPAYRPELHKDHNGIACESRKPR